MRPDLFRGRADFNAAPHLEDGRWRGYVPNKLAGGSNRIIATLGSESPDVRRRKTSQPPTAPIGIESGMDMTAQMKPSNPAPTKAVIPAATATAPTADARSAVVG